MSELIDKQAAIDALDKRFGSIPMEQTTEILLLRKDLRNLPSAQPEQRWIPCSERMPEPRVDVWCHSDMGEMIGYYEEYIDAWYGRDYLELIVTAWMPLPEPYKGGDSE